MSEAHCERFPECMEVGENKHIPKCAKADCPGNSTFFSHFLPSASVCDHDFGGWRDHKNEAGQVIGGEQVCKKCGMGAMEYTLRTGI